MFYPNESGFEVAGCGETYYLTVLRLTLMAELGEFLPDMDVVFFLSRVLDLNPSSSE
jgi:hypothetical protein